MDQETGRTLAAQADSVSGVTGSGDDAASLPRWGASSIDALSMSSASLQDVGVLVAGESSSAAELLPAPRTELQVEDGKAGVAE